MEAGWVGRRRPAAINLGEVRSRHVSGGDGPVLIEADSRAAGAAYRAFETWAGSDGIKVFFEPDTIMAIGQPGRRGFLYDEVYFITIWVSDGGERLLEILAEQLVPADRPWYEIKQPTDEPQPDRTLALVLEHGSPIDEVRHLI